MTSPIRSVFNWTPADPHKCSYLHKGSFNYTSKDYAYVIRPTSDGAQGTLRIRRELMLKFLSAYWPKTLHPKMPDILVAEQGYGWWKVESLSEVGDISVHTFFKYLNLWALRRAEVQPLTEKPSTPKRRHYTVTVEFEHYRVKRTQVLPAPKAVSVRQLESANALSKMLTDNASTEKTTPSTVDQSRLHTLMQTVNARYGHERRLH